MLFRSVSCDLQIFVDFFFNVYFLRERKHKRGRGREREGNAESGAGSRLQAVSTETDAGLELINCEIMT